MATTKHLDCIWAQSTIHFQASGYYFVSLAQIEIVVHELLIYNSASTADETLERQASTYLEAHVVNRAASKQST